MTLLCDNGILMPINSRIHAHAEDMLMILSKDTWSYDVAVRARFAWINVDAADDPGCACLNDNISC